jgi:hypothetical protein
MLVIDGKKSSEDGQQERSDKSSKIQTLEDMKGVQRSIIQLSAKVNL